MATTLFDSFLAGGTGADYCPIRLADGHVIAVRAAPAADEVDVYLPDEIPTPNDVTWGLEDAWEAWHIRGDEPMDGRFFYSVSVAAVRALIEEHGGEHADQITPA